MSTDAAKNMESAEVQTGGEAIVAALSAGGIDHLFFTSGSEIGFYQEAIAKSHALGHNNPVRLVSVPLEHVSLNAALGYAAVTGKPAATAAHVDCGTLHWGGAIHSAWRSGLPVVMTAGFPPTAATGTMKNARDEGGHIWMQETYDQNGIVRGYTKWDHRLTYQDNPGTLMSRAIQVAKTEPAGPVYMSIPKELTTLPMRESGFTTADQLGIPRAAVPHPDDSQALAERLIKAEHPVVVVGNSGRNPDSVPALVELCELLGIAVADCAVRNFICFPFTHPLYQTADTVKEADVALVLDVEVPWIPGTGAPDGAYVAVVAHDPIKQRIPTYEFTADMRIAADPTLTIKALTAAATALLTDADRKRIEKRSKDLAQTSAARRKADDDLAISHKDDTPIDPLWLSYQIGQAIDDNCIVLDDTLGGSRVRDYLPCTDPTSYIHSPGSSGGWAPGAALGAKLGAPDKDIVAVTGDGFYMFGTPAPAIWAAQQHKAPFMVVVYTNRSYTTGTAAVLRTYGEDSYAAKAGFEGGYFDPPIDFAMEAEAAGGYGENVTDPAEIGAALQRGLAQIRAGKPAVISVWLKRLVDGK
ncbi:MAG: thiamine pyrophosphate-requiring protein [Proteobacteria bacterium]|nr:thiamine pyrophosphate-requiring protein [Pseudomonadota bacterium]